MIGVVAWDMLLDCGSILVFIFFTGELGTDAELVSTGVVIFWPDVEGETRPVVGLDGGLFELHNPAVSSRALELISSDLPALIS